MSKSWALDDRAQLHKEANSLLDQNLIPGEPVVAILRGSYDSAMIATDRRVFVFKKGWMSGATLAKKLASFDYRNLTGVEVKTGFTTGAVVLQGPGITNQDLSTWSSGKGSAVEATYALMVRSEHYPQLKIGVPKLRELISAAQRGGSGAAADGHLDQLRKLGELRDAGVLTPAEFEAKKAEILRRV